MFKKLLYNSLILCFLVNAGIASGANLVVNGNFENGSTGWTEWTSPPDWVTGAFSHDYGSGCDIWTPTPYPYEGANTHCQSVGVNNVHGGLYQVINVEPGKTYTVSGMWSGGIGGLVTGSYTSLSWFEVTIYDGIATVADIDAAPGANDVIIAKKTFENATNPYSFGWEPFSDTFTAQSSQVTLALKTGKVGDWDAIAAYHDIISLDEVMPPAPIPTLNEWGMIIVALLISGSALWYMRRRRAF
jgi:hypothetical protein